MSVASAVRRRGGRLLVLHVRCAPTRHARSIPRRTRRLLPSSGRVAVPTWVGVRRPAATRMGVRNTTSGWGARHAARPQDESGRLLRPPCALRGSRRSVEVERSAVFQERFQRDSAGAGAPGSSRSAGGSRRPVVGRADLGSRERGESRRRHRAVPQRHVRGAAAVQRRRLADRQRRRQQLPLPRRRLRAVPREADQPLDLGQPHARDRVRHDRQRQARLRLSDRRTTGPRRPRRVLRASRRARAAPPSRSRPIRRIAFANSSSTQAPGRDLDLERHDHQHRLRRSDAVGKRSRDRHLHRDRTRPCCSPGAATSPRRSTGAPATAPARSPARRTTCGCSISTTAASATWTARWPPQRSRRCRRRSRRRSSSSSITLGQSVTDLATLAGPNGTVSGSVAFFVCGPSLVSNPDCSTGGSAVGSAVTLSGGTATSPAYTPTQAGSYCFRAQYSPDLFAQYSPGNHTNLTTECFEVVLPLGTLRVIKQVINDNGGTKGAGDFNLHVKSGGTDVAGSPAAGSATGTVYTLASGTYVVSEDAPPAGYAQTGISGDCAADGAVTVAAGMQKTCTIKNDDISPKLIVIKHVVNDEAGTSSGGELHDVGHGQLAQPGELRRRRGARHAGSDPPRRATASRRPARPATPAPSRPTAAARSRLGETKTCTVTNSDNDTPSSILVTKTADPTSLPEPGGNAPRSRCRCKNTSAVDSVSITSLTDDVYGDLDGKGTCDVPQTIAAGATYSCSFSGAVVRQRGQQPQGHRHCLGHRRRRQPGLGRRRRGRSRSRTCRARSW